jgi:hypothetical protein
MENRSQIVFINSKQRLSGTPYDYIINFNDGLLKADKKGYMQLTVVEATINRSWYSIQEGANSFNILDKNDNVTTITFPVAYYNAIDLRSALVGLMPTGWEVTYDRKTNKFRFRYTNMQQGDMFKFVFSNSLNEVLGFHDGESPFVTIDNDTIVSSVPIRVSEENAVVIHTDLPRRKFSSIDNHDKNNKSFKEATVLAKIPIEVQPFDNIVYVMSSPTFVYDLTANSISTVRVWVTDENDRKLILPHDWSMTVKIEFKKYDDNSDPMLDVRDYLKLMVLSDKNIISQ